MQTETGKNKLAAGLADDVILFHKTGSGSRRPDGIKIADNDAGYVILPDEKIYYITVMIRDSKLNDEENAKIISCISYMVYNYYHQEERT